MNYSYARDLACGHAMTANGWCSTARRARRRRKRFLTKLINLRTGEMKILGQSIAQFARDNGLCRNELNQLVVGNLLHYRDWVLAKSLELAGR